MSNSADDVSQGLGVSLDADELKLLKTRELELERRRLQLAKENGLSFYRPHPGQDAFHRAGTRKYRMVRCGNRYGKSTMGCAEDVAWLLGYRPWLPKSDPGRTAGIPARAVKGLVITTDWDKVDEIWTSERGDQPGKIWRFLPKGSVKSKKRNHSGAIEQIELNNGSIIRFDTVESFKKNPMGSESSDWDFIHIDEPCPEAMFKANARGLMDRGGSAWFTMTPLSEFWINDLFFPRQGQPSLFSPDKIWAAQGSTTENPYLTPEAIEDYIKLLNPEEVECRLNGIPLELSGLVYKAFNYKKHVLQELPKGWEDFNTPPTNYITYCAIDPHPQTPHAVLFVAVAPTGQRFIYDEMFVKCGAEDLTTLILHKLKGRFHATPKCDPWVWQDDPITGSSLAEEFGKHGLWVEKASKSKTHGILKMQGEFKKNDIFVSPNLQRFLFEINRYCYDKENKPVDKDDHLMECMYRIFINTPLWFDPDTASYAVGDESITTVKLDLPDLSTLD